MSDSDSDSSGDLNQNSNDLHVKNFVRLMLFSEHKKIPVKREDVLHKLHINGRTFDEVLKLSKKKFNESFGFDVVEIPYIPTKTVATTNAARKAKVQKVEKPSHQYCLVSKISHKFVDQDKDLTNYGILSLLLCFIALNEGKISADLLLTKLKKFDIIEEFDSSLAELIKQKYIIKEIIEDSYTLRFGPRSIVEFPKENLAKIIVKVDSNLTKFTDEPKDEEKVLNSIIRLENKMKLKASFQGIEAFMEPGVLLSARQYVKNHQSFYPISYNEFTVLYPNLTNESFPLVSPLRENEFDPLEDLKKTLECVSTVLKDTKPVVKQIIAILTDGKEIEKLKKLEGELNQIVYQKCNYTLQQLDYDLISHVLDASYDRIIDNPSLLNKYKNFTHEVYGEANSSFVKLMLGIVKANKKHIFVDLGSGIGSVVLYAAAQFQCQSYGIEMRNLPSAYAKSLQIEFQSRLACFKRKMAPVHLKQGNFLTDEEFLLIIQKADIIFTNNVAFGPDLNAKLLDIFVCLKDGAKIISLVNYAPVDMTVNQYKAYSPSSILDVEKFEYPPGSVSWTSSGGSFYVHTVNRNRLKGF